MKDLTPHYIKGPHLLCHGTTHHWGDNTQIVEWCDSKSGGEAHRLLKKKETVCARCNEKRDPYGKCPCDWNRCGCGKRIGVSSIMCATCSQKVTRAINA